MRIVALEATNVKALRAVAIIPNGNVIQLAGENGAGKSSVLDAICFALGGKKLLPSQPVRRGQVSAVVHLDLGTVKVTRKFAADGSTSVSVEAESGAVFRSPQTLLDSLFGQLTFDPLRFALAEPKQQLETLRGLVKLDVDIDALDGQHARDYELRREWNRKVASLKDRVLTLAGGLEDVPIERVDIDSLTAEIEQASARNAAVTDRRMQMAQIIRQMDAVDADGEATAREIERLNAKLNRLKADKSALAAHHEELRAVDSTAAMVDVSDLRAQINEGMKRNTLADAHERHRKAHAVACDELTQAEAQSDRLTAAMEERTALRTQVIASAKMPIDGLGFGDGEVLYKGLPFDQASQGERIRVSFAVAVAMSPKLRVALIRDGSLLDGKNLALIEQLANEGDFQVWVERVGNNQNVGILIEDGQVAAIDGTRIESPDEVGATQ